MTRHLSFFNMIPAMDLFHATKDSLYVELETMVDGDISDELFNEWKDRCKVNDDTIREAYYLDTSDRNSRNTMDMISAESLIELTQKIIHSRI